MKIVIGHKNLNLDELYDVSCHPTQPEVVVDSQTFNELESKLSHSANKEQQSAGGQHIELNSLTKEHERAILLVKLLQLLKLKKSATKQSVEFITKLLNQPNYQPIIVSNKQFSISNLGFLQSSKDKGFFVSFFEVCKDNNIFFNDKELFVLGNHSHVYQAVFALEIQKLYNRLPLLDSTLVFTLETLHVSEDYVTQYALTNSGKQSVGALAFKSNILALVDKSKLVITSGVAEGTKVAQDIELSKVYAQHVALHDKLHSLKLQLVSDINTDYGSLFNEKKYKELLIIGQQQQKEQLSILQHNISFLVTLIKQLTQLSIVRENHLKTAAVVDTQMKQEEEEEKTSAATAVINLQAIFDTLSADLLSKQYSTELYTAFKKNKEAESTLKQSAAQQEAEEEGAKKEEEEEQKTTTQITQQQQQTDGAASKDNKKQQQLGNKKKKQIVASLQFGKGTRQLFDHLLLITSSASSSDYDTFLAKVDVHRNREIESIFQEILETKNEERRKPKCAKGTRDMTPIQMAIKEKALNIIKQVFKRHGATEIDTPVFELKETLTGKYGEESKLIYDLEHQGGELLSLRYDLTVPFARYCGERGLSSIKRYHIAKVYRRDQPQVTKGRFREFYQCDFDIAGHYSLMIPDAEVLQVLNEILTQLDIGCFVIKVNHRKFLDAMVDICGCEKRKFKAICSSVDKLDKEPWAKVKEELIQVKGLTEEMTNKLEKFVELKGKPFEMIKLIKDKQLFLNNKEGEETIKEMEVLFSYLQAMNPLTNFSFDFSLARGLDYYTGLIYEAVLTDANQIGSIAGGGRYDGLVGMFSAKSIPAVGVSVGIERIFSILEDRAKLDATIREVETQVLVAQAGKNLTVERMRLLAELWAAQIKAETMYKDNPNMKQQMDACFDAGIPIMLVVGEDEIKQNVVNIKNLNTHEQITVKREEYIEKLKEIISQNPVLLIVPPKADKGEQKAAEPKAKGAKKQ